MYRAKSRNVSPELNVCSSATSNFVYGLNIGDHRNSTRSFLKQAETSAQTFRDKNPKLKLGIFTTDPLAIKFPFDFIGKIDYKYILNNRQWLTRLIYMKKTPFEVTLAVDSQALCCSSRVYDLLESYYTRQIPSGFDFDIAYNAKFGLSLKHLHFFEPHNWLLLYRMNIAVDRLFNTWRSIHEPLERKKGGRDDQTTLYKAIRYERHRGLRVGRVSNNFAVAVVESKVGTDKRRRSSHLLAPDECHIIHLIVLNQKEELRVFLYPHT